MYKSALMREKGNYIVDLGCPAVDKCWPTPSHTAQNQGALPHKSLEPFSLSVHFMHYNYV